MDEDIIVTDIVAMRLETMHAGSPWIYTAPRDHSAIVYTLEGMGSYSAEGIYYTHSSGEVSVVPGGQPDVSDYLTDTVKYIFIDFHTDKPFSCSPGALPLVTKPKQTETYRLLFEKALSIWNSRPFYYKSQCREILYTIINWLILENYTQTEAYYKYLKIKNAVEYIENSFACEITSSQIAELCSISVSTLNRLFAEVYNMTPGQYLSRTRIRYGIELLKKSNNNVSEIALLCGYSDTSAFSHVFKRMTGVSPSNYDPKLDKMLSP